MNQNAGAHYGERTRKIWIGGVMCDSILDGLALIRTMAGDDSIEYHNLYHALRTGKCEYRGVSISMSAPRAAEEREAVSHRAPERMRGGPLLARVCRSWLGVHH